MGMYTGLRAKVKIKPEYDSTIKTLYKESCWDNTNAPNLDEWMKYQRYNSIPFCQSEYMPDDFYKNEDRHIYEEIYDRVWEFACSLKNSGEIQFFVPNVLFPMCDEVYYCQSLFEEYPYPSESTSFGYPNVDSENWWEQYAIDWKISFED